MKKEGWRWSVLGLAGVAALFLGSCFTAIGPDVGGETPQTHGYVAGSISLSGVRGACYWIDGVRTDLEGNNSQARGIGVANGHVYVVGQYDGNKACLWTDGVRQNLDGGTVASSIVIAGTTVVIGGQANSKACVWVNGTRYEVSESDSYANSVAVYNGTIYLAGAYLDTDSNFKAALWTRPVSGGTWEKTTIHTNSVGGSSYDYSEALSIAVQNGNILVGGSQHKESDGPDYPFLWSGTTPSALTAAALPTPSPHSDLYGHVYGVFLYNGQPYAAGFYNTAVDPSSATRAALWTGSGDPALYAPGDENDSAASSVFVHNGDLYVAGNIEKPTTGGGSTFIQPCYWKNGVRIELPAPELGSSDVNDFSLGASAIVVQ